MVFGYDYERQGGGVSGTQVERDNHGLFLYEQLVGGAASVSLGRRARERNSAFGMKATPRGAASYRLASSTYLRASGRHRHHRASLIENYSNDMWSVGNPNLRPEKAISYEAGLVDERFGRRLRTEVSAFAQFVSGPDRLRLRPDPRHLAEHPGQPRARPGVSVAGEAGLLAVALGKLHQDVDARHALLRAGFALRRCGAGTPSAARQLGAASVSVTPKRWRVQMGRGTGWRAAG